MFAIVVHLYICMLVVSCDMLSAKLVAITLQFQLKHFSNKYFTRSLTHTHVAIVKQITALYIYMNYCTLYSRE